MKRSNWMPNNCPVIIRTADGISCGRCYYYMKDTRTCPTHGRVIDEEKPMTQKELITMVVVKLELLRGCCQTPSITKKQIGKSIEEFIETLGAIR